MGTKMWVSASAVVVLVAAVVLVRGDTAAVESDLVADAPEPSASAAPATPAQDRLEANGLDGARIGSRQGQQVFRTGESSTGCTMAMPLFESSSTDTRAQDDWQTSTWLVDGLVAAVLVQGYGSTLNPQPGLRTWLGPGLGSPLREAQLLPGARTATEQPFGGAGPTVKVVTVPGDGVEVVVSDVPSSWSEDGSEVAGRESVITTIEVRRPAARVCAVEDDPSIFSGVPDTLPRLDLDGVDGVRLGDDAETLVADGLLEGTQLRAAEGCQAYGLVDEPVTVTAVDGVVVQVQVFGLVETSFGLPRGADLAAVRAAFPQLGQAAGTGSAGRLSVVVDGATTVALEMYPEFRFVPDVEAPVTGGPPVVQSVTVRATDVPASSLLC